jgi:hypothetical protein
MVRTKDEVKLGARKSEKRFGTILLDSIDEALSTLGENSKKAIYFHLETKFGISKQDIPGRVSDFSEAIEHIFGVAAQQIEILIMKCLNQQVECSYNWVGPKWLVPDITFTKYVKLLELWYEDAEKNGKMEVILDERRKPDQKNQ